MVSRRNALAVLAAAAWPGLSWGQRASTPGRVGILMSGNRTSAMAWLAAFRDALRGLGYGKDLHLELRFADGQVERLPALAGELVKRNIQALVATDPDALKAAKGTATKIPIIVAGVVSPAELGAKQVELLTSVLPKLSRIALLMNPANSSHRALFTSIGAAAEAKGIRVLGVEANLPVDIESAFVAMSPNRIGAVVIAQDGLFTQEVDRIAGLALKRRLATIGSLPTYAGAGCLLSYGQDAEAAFLMAAEKVDFVLKGSKAGDLPVEAPPPLRLIVNRKTAKALGVTIPQTVLARADRVIE